VVKGLRHVYRSMCRLRTRWSHSWAHRTARMARRRCCKLDMRLRRSRLQWVQHCPLWLLARCLVETEISIDLRCYVKYNHNQEGATHHLDEQQELQAQLCCREAQLRPKILPAFSTRSVFSSNEIVEKVISNQINCFNKRPLLYNAQW
jgi:hypothetical protein